MSNNVESEATVALRTRLAYEYARTLYQRLHHPKKRPYRAGRCWDGESDDGLPRVSIWLQLVRLCRKNNIDPVRYVVWHLLTARNQARRAPEPNLLLGDGALAEYRDSLPSRRQALASQLLSQRQIAAVNISYWQGGGPGSMDFVESHSFVLLDESLDLSALFRYCLALQLIDKNGDDIFHSTAEDYRVEAAAQYHQSPDDYDVAWKGFIPPGFRARAAEIFDRLIGMDRYLRRSGRKNPRR